jgi:hypothetical protein
MSRKRYAGKNNPNWRGGQVKRICLSCGKTFSAYPAWIKKGRSEFCSSLCWGKAQKGTVRLLRRIRQERKCLICGNIFEAIPSSKKKCCSLKCANICGGKKNRKRIIRTCCVCGKTFEVLPFLTKRFPCKFCSSKCMGKWNSKNIIGEKHSQWKGGKKESYRRRLATEKQFGFKPLNKPFDGCEGHHINFEEVIHIPKKLHRSNWHSVITGVNMEKINKLAFEFLRSQ